MVVGMAAIFMFMTVDTFFVGQLGVSPLAALGFCMPVTFIVLSAGVGIATGTTAVIARAIGAGDQQQVRRLTTDALLFGLVFVTGLGLLGLLTIEPLFRAMGASEETLPLVREYMLPWYLGVGFLVIPMVGNAAVRATGDTKTPMLIMLLSGVVNLGLDPLLIFGWGPFPRLEIRGAAIATVISWMVTFTACLWVLHRREQMLELRPVPPRQVFASWRRITRIGVPAASANVLSPLSIAVITSLVARFGEDAVAAFGVGRRIEMLATVGTHALAVGIAPFAAQNLGAENWQRIRDSHLFAGKAALVWGALVAAILALIAPQLAGLFNGSPAVVASSTDYLRTIPASYGLFGCALATSSLFNAVGTPLRAVLVVLSSAFGLAVPLAYLGSSWAGFSGLLWGVAAANAGVGVLAWSYARLWLRRRANAGHVISAHTSH